MKIYDYICEVCKNNFTSKRKNVKFCSNICRGKIHFNNLLINNEPWNKVKNKIRNCTVCNKKLHSQTKTGLCIKHYNTQEHKNRLSIAAKKAGVGGYQIGSGYGKSGWYKGYRSDSTWELAWIIYNLDHNIKFERNRESFVYEYKNKKHKYYPDFILEDGTYVEIKGYETDVFIEKIKYFTKPIKIYYRDDMKPIFEYVHSKYGKDIKKLYETTHLSLESNITHED